MRHHNPLRQRGIGSSFSKSGQRYRNSQPPAFLDHPAQTIKFTSKSQVSGRILLADPRGSPTARTLPQLRASKSPSS